MNYKQQLAVIEGLFVPPDSQIRMDCPFCKNKNTLSVDTTENKIGWSIDVKWSNGKEESITEIPDDVASVIDDYLTEIEGEQA